MSYIYVIRRGAEVVGVSAKKYGIRSWLTDQPDGMPTDDIIIQRYGDCAEWNRYADRVTFTLDEYLENPDRKYR